MNRGTSVLKKLAEDPNVHMMLKGLSKKKCKGVELLFLYLVA